MSSSGGSWNSTSIPAAYNSSTCCGWAPTFEIVAMSFATFVLFFLSINFVRCLHDRRRSGRGGGGQKRLGGGLDPEAIAALPAYPYRRKDASAPATECSICLGGVEDGDMVKVMPSCAHMFHRACIDLWLQGQSTCPVCRAEVLAEARPGRSPSGASGGEVAAAAVVAEVAAGETSSGGKYEVVDLEKQ